MPRLSKGSLTPEQAFAKVLRKVRTDRGLSQEALGFDSGYHRTYIGMLERGLMNPSLRTLLSISSALEMPAAEFIHLVEARLGKPWRRPDRKLERHG
jgi:transcriptional regulator with XRE-family HTH domain